MIERAHAIARNRVSFGGVYLGGTALPSQNAHGWRSNAGFLMAKFWPLGLLDLVFHAGTQGGSAHVWLPVSLWNIWWTWWDSNSRPLPCHLRNINHLRTFWCKTKDLAVGDLDSIGLHGRRFRRFGLHADSSTTWRAAGHARDRFQARL